MTAAWTLWNGQQHVVQSATRVNNPPPPAGTPKDGWSAPATVANVDGLYPSLSVNARGDAGVVVSISPYTSTLGACGSQSQGTCAVYAFRSGPTGNWDAPIAVSPTLSSSVGYVSGAQVALDADGRTMAVGYR